MPMTHKTLKALSQAIEKLQTLDQKETLANEHIALIQNTLTLDEIQTFLETPFGKAQTNTNSAFLNPLRQKGCERLIAQIDQTENPKEKVTLAIKHAEFFAWSDNYYFMNTIKQLPKKNRYQFIQIVLQLKNNELKAPVKTDVNLWSIIFLLEAIPFLPEGDQENFKKQLCKIIDGVPFFSDLFQTPDYFQKLLDKTKESLPLKAPSPEYMTGIIYACPENQKLSFAKKSLTNLPNTWDFNLYQKPSIDFLIKTLIALPQNTHADFIKFYYTNILLTNTEINNALDMTVEKVNEVLWNTITPTDELNEQATIVSESIKKQFSSAHEDINKILDEKSSHPLGIQPLIALIEMLKDFNNKPELYNIFEGLNYIKTIEPDPYKDQTLEQLLLPENETECTAHGQKAIFEKIDLNNYSINTTILNDLNKNSECLEKTWRSDFIQFLALKTAHVYLSLIKNGDFKGNLSFAEQDAWIITLTNPKLFIEAVHLLEPEDKKEFIIYTFDSLALIENPIDPLSYLAAIGELSADDQNLAIEAFKRAIPNISWNTVINHAIAGKFPIATSPHHLIGLLYLLPEEARWTAATRLLEIQPSQNWAAHEKPSVDFVKSVMKALPSHLMPEPEYNYAQYFIQTMAPVLTQKEIKEIKEIKSIKAEPVANPPMMDPEELRKKEAEHKAAETRAQKAAKKEAEHKAAEIAKKEAQRKAKKPVTPQPQPQPQLAKNNTKANLKAALKEYVENTRARWWAKILNWITFGRHTRIYVINEVNQLLKDIDAQTINNTDDIESFLKTKPHLGYGQDKDGVAHKKTPGKLEHIIDDKCGTKLSDKNKKATLS